jgi:Bacteriophage tail sheath protein
MTTDGAQTRMIQPAATAVTAFVGRALRGPVDRAVRVNSYVEFETTFGGLWEGSALAYAVRDFFHIGGTTAAIVRVHQPAPGDTASLVVGSGASRLVLEAAAPGSWGAGLSAVVDDDIADRANRTAFNLTIVDEATRKVEIFHAVSFAAGSQRRVDAIVEQQSALVRVPGALPTAGLEAYPERATATGGNDGVPLTAASFSTGPNLRSQHRGIYALDLLDPINLIVIPPYTATGDIDDSVLLDVISYAEERGAIAIVDPPSSWDSAATVAAAVTDPGFPSSENAALYFPSVRRPDPAGGRGKVTMAPSGSVAGVIARTDALRGVWKAPAGVGATLDGVTGLAVAMNDDEIGQLTLLGVNCLRPVPGAGYVVWGARTRAGTEELDSQWKYLQVRRMALFIETSLRRGLRWVESEPNGEQLWGEIRSVVEAFAAGLFRQGAFAGTKPEEAYFVKCGPDTISEEEAEHGSVNVVVGYAPMKPAEFVTLRLALTAAPPRHSRLRRRPSFRFPGRPSHDT